MCICDNMRECVCVCVRARVCVCVCVDFHTHFLGDNDI